ncbi:MAG: 4-vinyl reductase [Anaerolineae bacterium]|nr:4-vinyl reductase [Anaerolineae bacterium]
MLPHQEIGTPQRAASGLYYPNRFARIVIEVLEEILGRNGLNTVLNLADLGGLVDQYPPDNLKREFDFADFTALNVALEDLYGPRGARGLALRAGRASFTQGLWRFETLVALSDVPGTVLPLNTKLDVGVTAMANVFSKLSDQISNIHDEGDDRIVYTLERCPMCWNRTADRPVHTLIQGFLQEGLRWVSGGQKFNVEMTTCLAMGDEIGRCVIYKQPIG